MLEKFTFEAFRKKNDKTKVEPGQRDLIGLARQAQESFAANDFGDVLECLNRIKERTLPESERTPEGLSLREIKALFKNDFLGIPEIEKFTGRKFSENEKKQIARMWTEKIKEQKITREDLERLKNEGFMVVLRTPTIMHEGSELLATIENLQKKFKDLFSDLSWYKNEKLATDKENAVRMAWAIVKKEVLDESRSKNWDEQGKYLQQWAKEHKIDSGFVTRRTPAEAAYDISAYYHARDKHILEKDWDWTDVQSSDGYFMLVGKFGSNGLGVNYVVRGYSSLYLGVCPSR